MTKYTNAEIKAILAPLLRLDPEDIDEFVIITRGKCDNCTHRDGYVTLDSADSLVEFVEYMNGGLDCRIAAVI